MMATDFGCGMMGNYSPFGYWGFGFIILILFWGLIIWLVVWLIMKFIKSQQKSESALDILKKRFAKGEITKKEFDEMKKGLQH